MGLAPPREELSYYQEQVILFVAGQRSNLRRDADDGADLDDEETAFRAEADPAEMEVSDAELLSNLAAARSKRHGGSH